jgi:hypothetical protein
MRKSTFLKVDYALVFIICNKVKISLFNFAKNLHF